MDKHKSFYLNYVKDMIIYEAMKNSFSCNWNYEKEDILKEYNLTDDEFDTVIDRLYAEDYIIYIDYEEEKGHLELNISPLINIGYVDEYGEFGDYYELKQKYLDEHDLDKEMTLTFLGENNGWKGVSISGRLTNKADHVEVYYNDEHHLEYFKEIFKAEYFDALYESNIIEHQNTEDQEPEEDEGLEI